MRLTNEFRDELIGRALVHAFKAREKAHDKATVALADAVHAHEYGAASKIADKLPQGWVGRTTRIFITAAGFAPAYQKTGKMRHDLPMSSERAVPRYQDNRPVVIGGDHPLNDQAQAVAAEHAAIRDDKESLRVKLRALVYSVNTLARLLEAWPECKPFLPASAPKPTTALVPVELVPELNAALGITTKGGKK